MSSFQLYVTFSGEPSKGTTITPIKHVRAFDASGSKHGRVTPDYDELRGMALDASGQFYLAVAQSKSSTIEAFSAAIGSDGYSRTLLGTTASPGIAVALDHPYELAFNGANLFVSNQDTNVVAGFAVPSAGYPATVLTVASYLTSTFTSGGTFYDGTYVASAQPVTRGNQTPPIVPAARGGLTMTGFPPGSEPAAAVDAAKAPAKHSVRGMLFAGGVLYVADEAGARVTMYDPATGAYAGALGATTDGTYTFSTPVGLAVNPVSGHVYIGDPGNDAIFSYHPSSKNVKVEVDKKSAGDAVEKVSGLAVAPDGTLFFGSRKAQSSAAQASLAKSTSTYTISTCANGKVAPFATGLTDTPECLLIVPV